MYNSVLQEFIKTTWWKKRKAALQSVAKQKKENKKITKKQEEKNITQVVKKAKPTKKQSKENNSKPTEKQNKENNSKKKVFWKYDKTAKKGDYIYAIVPDHPAAIAHGYVLEHRIVMENHLGRLLRKDEDVHHIDGNKKNNDISNLAVVLHSEHARRHKSHSVPDYL